MSLRRLSTVAKRLAARSQSLPPDAVMDCYADAVVYRYTDAKGRACARGYVGTAGRADFAHWFVNEQARETFVGAWRSKRAKHVQRMQATRDANKAFCHDFTAGTILCASWGYDQTNINFYQVVRIISPRMIEMREIEQDSQESAPASMVGTCTPKPGEFKPAAKTLRRRVTPSGVKVTAYCRAYAWEGDPMHWTAYA